MSITWSIVTSEPTIAGMPVTVKVSSRARRLRLRVDPRGRSVLLTVPRRVSQKRALAWAAGQSEWLRTTIAAMPAETPIAPGATIPFRGTPHRVDWCASRPRRIDREEGRLSLGGPVETVASRVLRWLRIEAQALLEEETREFASRAGVMASKVRVGDPVSRWGSCSTSGTISYSWRLVLAPDLVRRATVAHEVAHLVHMNHGPDFHALVERLVGDDAKSARQWLRRNGAALQQVGGGNTSIQRV